MEPAIKHCKKILRNYNLGIITSIKRQSKGYSNANFKITTPDNTYILRICKNKSLKHVEYELKVMRFLENRKFPTAYPIHDETKGYINKSKAGYAVLYNFKKGKEPKLNRKVVNVIGSTLASLNSIKKKKLKRKNPLDIRLCKKVIKERKSAQNDYNKIFDYLEKGTKYLEKLLKVKVPQGLIHGDLYPDNTLFKRKKLVAILDFEDACIDKLVLDIGATINGFCFKDGLLNEGLLKSFLRGYEKVRKLSPMECELLPYYMQWNAHIMVAWHLDAILKIYTERQYDRVVFQMKRAKYIRKNQHKIERMIKGRYK